MRVGALDVSILVDAEGSFATTAEAFPALSGDGFAWSSLAEEREAAVE